MLECCTNLIAEGLERLGESKVSVRCREADRSMVEGVLSAAQSKYGKKVALTVDAARPLPAAPQCTGGVVLSARNDSILCDNTIDSRLDIAFEQCLPGIRAMLFGNTSV